jgi:hypothetical protein
MFYSLLGRAVWFAAKWYAHKRLGNRRALAKPLLFGGGAAVLVGLIFAAAHRNGGGAAAKLPGA